MTDLLLDLLLASLILLAIYGVGRAMQRWVPLATWSASADLAISLALGLGCIATLLFLLALLNLLISPVAWALLAIGGVLTAAQWQSVRRDALLLLAFIRIIREASLFAKLASLIALLFVALNLVGDLAPPLEGDTVHQYLLMSREWATAGRYVQPTHIWAATLPGNMMMISAWALLLRSSFSLATLVTGFGFSLFFALAVFALARQYFEPIPSLLAAIIAYTMPDVGYLAQSAKVDMGWAFFEILALAAFFRWLDLTRPILPDETSGNRWLFLTGIFLGFAAGSKNQTFISITLLGSWLLFRMLLRGDLRAFLSSAAVFGMGVLIVGFPYYLYNGIVHHNPFYPVFADVFVRWGGTPSPRSELGTEIFYPWTVGGYLTNLWNMSLGHGPAFYLGFIAGPLLLLTLPVSMLLGVFRGQRVAWRMIGYAFVFSIVWFLVKQAARHFLPGLVLLSIVSGFALWKLSQNHTLSRNLILSAAVICMIGNFSVWLGVFYWSSIYRVALGLETRTQFLERIHDDVLTIYSPDWTAIDYLNGNLTAEDRVLTVHAAQPLYITPQVVSGNWGDRLAYDRIIDSDALLQALDTHKISFILIYKEDDVAQMPVFAQPDFLAEHARQIVDGQRTSLYKLVSAGEQ